MWSSIFERFSFRKIASALRGMPKIPATILIIFVVCGLFGSFFSPHNPTKMRLMDSKTPPVWQAEGTLKYILGTDHQGRDMLSRIISGAGVSMQVGFVVIFFAGGLGTIMALLAGYLGGWVDTLISRVMDTFLSLPYMLVAIAMAAVLGPSKNNIILILVLIGWAGYARILRSEVLRIKEGDFVRLAKVAGASRIRIMWRHIFPGTINTLLVMATLQMGNVILTEAALSFLGVGVPPPHPAWGSMLADGRNYITSAWWMCVWPGVAIMLVVLSSNLMGDWLRVRLDPKFRQI